MVLYGYFRCARGITTDLFTHEPEDAVPLEGLRDTHGQVVGILAMLGMFRTPPAHRVQRQPELPRQGIAKGAESAGAWGLQHVEGAAHRRLLGSKSRDL